MYNKKILIDLDGVLNEYGKDKFDENCIPEMKEGAEEFIKELSKEADLYLFTTRNTLLSTKWLISNNIEKYFKDVTNVKLPAYLYIDDRAICFKGNFKEALDKIKSFKAYWKS